MTKDEALAQPEQEPVAWMNKHGACMSAVFKEVDATGGEYTIPLYTFPPQRHIDFGPQPNMHGGLNQEDWKDIVAAISKARDNRGIYLGCRPADVFQDWFLAMGLFKPKEQTK